MKFGYMLQHEGGLKYYTKWKKIVWFYLYEIPGIDKCIDTESRLEATRARG